MISRELGPNCWNSRHHMANHRQMTAVLSNCHKFIAIVRWKWVTQKSTDQVHKLPMKLRNQYVLPCSNQRQYLLVDMAPENIALWTWVISYGCCHWFFDRGAKMRRENASNECDWSNNNRHKVNTTLVRLHTRDFRLWIRGVRSRSKTRRYSYAHCFVYPLGLGCIPPLGGLIIECAAHGRACSVYAHNEDEDVFMWRQCQ